ncbi:hypothetical protein EYF80_039525 [Liparis tanakae]|uniref:Uncharacterized protein n=1 Tax=Liparis tanakae TaxID=230148 RepID=A0A4Z2GAI8_9TELE|nr:hypothetical protein EYF80_039525 [Liparis tanakae]
MKVKRRLTASRGDPPGALALTPRFNTSPEGGDCGSDARCQAYLYAAAAVITSIQRRVHWEPRRSGEQSGGERQTERVAPRIKGDAGFITSKKHAANQM